MSGCGQPTRGSPQSSGLGGGITIPRRENQHVTKCYARLRADSLGCQESL